MNIIIALESNNNNNYYNQIHNLICPAKDVTITSIVNDIKAVKKLLDVQNTDILILDNALPAAERIKMEQAARKRSIRTYLLEISMQKDLTLFLYQVSKSYILNTGLTVSPGELTYRNALSPKIESTINEINEPIRIEDIKRIQEGINYLFDYLAVPKHLKGYQYLSAAVEMLYANPHRYNEMKHTMYRLVSVKFNTTQIKVSKGIRLAVLQTLQKGNVEALHQLGFRKYSISEIGNDEHKNNLPSTFCFVDALVSELYRILLEF